MLRRASPFLLVSIGVALLLGWYVLYTQRVVRELRAAARLQGRLSSRIYSALADTGSSEGTRLQALLDLAGQVRESGVPLVLLDPEGNVADTANLPLRLVGGALGDSADSVTVQRMRTADSLALRAYVDALDERDAAIEAPGAGTVYIGDSQLVRGLSTIPIVQSGAIGLLLLFGAWGLRERGRAEREKVWAGMARESAHQLGTPLSSLAGWVELLADDPDADPSVQRAVTHMQQDLARLDRVSHRFERIGRPPRRDAVELGALVDRLAAYFAARVPQGSRKVIVRAEHPDDALVIAGDQVLLEWVLEVLTKNALDALGGRGGEVVLSASPVAEGGARIRVRDDGPGVPKALRKKIFEAGVTTKERGWGIGLALARRIVEENHGGRLVLANEGPGATFDVILPG
ncbi:MAG: HAMP domain-containing histidine kinase [Gemmatimonadaceae bacterium]|jgi:signal transduction histidine kinase|nr:HAMP domain-containing histidine kinase [Gemmatimonadaceae bacterium]